MSRKREQARQSRISNRLAAGTYTAPRNQQAAEHRAEQMGYLNDFLQDNKLAEVDGKKPATAKPYKGGLSIKGGFGGQGKDIYFVSEINVRALQDTLSATLDAGYYIWNIEVVEEMREALDEE